MNRNFKRLLSVTALCLALPAAVHAQIVFHDSFENDAESDDPAGYNLPNSGSNPAYNNLVSTGVTNTTPSDSNYNMPNQGLTQLSNNSGSHAGQDGSYSVYIGNEGGSGDNDGPPFSDRTPSNQTATLTTVNGDAGIFAASTTYTLTFYAAGNPGDGTQSFSGLLLDGSNSTTLASDTVQDSTLADNNFDKYSFTFDTLTSPSVIGDSIQIGLQAAQSSGQPFNRGTLFDNITLTAAPDVVPEPSSIGLLLLSVGALALGVRGRFVGQRE